MFSSSWSWCGDIGYGTQPQFLAQCSSFEFIHWGASAEHFFHITLWLFNIAMEHGPFIDDFPMKTSIYKGFPMAMFNNQMVQFLEQKQDWPKISSVILHFFLVFSHWWIPKTGILQIEGSSFCPGGWCFTKKGPQCMLTWSNMAFFPSGKLTVCELENHHLS